MAYILGLVIVGLLFLTLHYLTELNKLQKIVVTLTLIAIISAAVAYNSYEEYRRDNMLNVVLKYNQNKTVKCHGLDVNNSTYSLSEGTYTFIGKENTPNFNQMISVTECQ